MPNLNDWEMVLELFKRFLDEGCGIEAMRRVPEDAPPIHVLLSPSSPAEGVVGRFVNKYECPQWHQRLLDYCYGKDESGQVRYSTFERQQG